MSGALAAKAPLAVTSKKYSRSGPVRRPITWQRTPCQADPARFGLFDDRADVSHIVAGKHGRFRPVRARGEAPRPDNFCGAKIRSATKYPPQRPAPSPQLEGPTGWSDRPAWSRAIPWGGGCQDQPRGDRRWKSRGASPQPIPPPNLSVTPTYERLGFGFVSEAGIDLPRFSRRNRQGHARCPRPRAFSNFQARLNS
jgi:hypothetical protein